MPSGQTQLMWMRRSPATRRSARVDRLSPSITAAWLAHPDHQWRGAHREPRGQVEGPGLDAAGARAVTTGRGRSRTRSTRSATSPGCSSFPENDIAARVVELVEEHRGPHAVGADAADVDAPLARDAQVGEGREAEPHHRVLGGGVHRLAGHRCQAGERGDVDDVAAPGRAHQLEGGDGAVHRAERVDLEHQPARLVGGVPRRPGDQDAGVVDPEVEAVAPLGGQQRGLAAGLGVAYVERGAEDVRPGLVADLPGRLGGEHLVDVGEVDDVPATGQPQGDLAAEAAAGAGDQGAAQRR